MPNQTRFSTFIRRQPRWRIGAVALILALGVLWLKGGGKSAASATASGFGSNRSCEGTLAQGSPPSASEGKNM